MKAKKNKEKKLDLKNASSRLSEYYYPNEYSFRIRYLTNLIISKLKKGKALDIGMGSGWLMKELFLSGITPVGIDAEERAVQEAKLFLKQENLNFKVSKSDALKTQFKKDSFDNVILFNVFEHIHPQEKALKEVRRILKDKGVLVIVIPNPQTYGLVYDVMLPKISKNLSLFHTNRLSKDYKKFGINIKHQEHGHDLHILRYNSSVLQKMMKDLGFKILLFKNSGFISHFISSFLCSVLGLSRKRIKWIEYLDMKIAGVLPHKLGIGWVIIAEKQEVKSEEKR